MTYAAPIIASPIALLAAEQDEDAAYDAAYEAEWELQRTEAFEEFNEPDWSAWPEHDWDLWFDRFARKTAIAHSKLAGEVAYHRARAAYTAKAAAQHERMVQDEGNFA